MSLNMWGKWVLSASGERYLDSLGLIINDRSKSTKKEAIAYWILRGIRDDIPLPALETLLTHMGIERPYRVLQNSLEDYQRNRWVHETNEDYSAEEIEDAQGVFNTLDKPPEIPKGFEDFKDHF